MDLSNFYKNFSFKYTDFEFLFKVYTDIMASINDYAVQVKNNTIIPDIETYRIFPFQRMSAKDALYNVTELMDNPRIVKKYVLDGMSLSDRVDMWNNGEFTLAQQVDMLDMAGNYISIEAKRGFTNEKDYPIIDFNMFDSDGAQLFRNTDFVLSTNRIYLLGDIATPSSEKHIIITDIAIDFNTSENIMGKAIHVTYNDAVTRNEYNEILKMLTAASLGGPTVANLKSSIKAIAGFDQGDLYDKFVRDASKQARWKKHNYTDFDFVVVFPEEYASNMEKLQMIIDYLKLVKPAYTKFFIILQSLYSDLYNILIRANDAYNLDRILEHTEDDANLNVQDSDIEDHATETTDEYYEPIPPTTLMLYRLNSDTGRLNVNLYTFGNNPADEFDWHVVDYVTEHMTDIYAAASMSDEGYNVISSTDDEVVDAGVDDLIYSHILETIEDPYLITILDEMIADNLAEVFSDDYLPSGIIEDSSFSLVETPTEESYNNVSDDSYSLTVSTETSPHYRLNSTQRLNVEIRTDRITDVVVYNY